MRARSLALVPFGGRLWANTVLVAPVLMRLRLRPKRPPPLLPGWLPPARRPGGVPPPPVVTLDDAHGLPVTPTVADPITIVISGVLPGAVSNSIRTASRVSICSPPAVVRYSLLSTTWMIGASGDRPVNS